MFLFLFEKVILRFHIVCVSCEKESLFLTFLISTNFCRPLIIFAKSLDPDQDRQNVGPELDPNRLTL